MRPLAGGTDLYAATEAASLKGPILDITALPDLQGYSEEESQWRLGACLRWSEIVAADLPPAFDGLKLAAREVGGRQIQNSGTLAGNLCNASPAADGVPPLLTLDASVELASLSGTRVLPLSAFILGPREIARRSDELVTAILVPKTAATGQSDFLKLGARKYLVISISMVATRLRLEEGRIREAALAVGACSAVARRLTDLEARLSGLSVPEALERLDDATVTAALAPIDDPRASAAYRGQAAGELLRRSFLSAAGEAA